MTQQPTFPEFVTEPATTTLGRLEQIPLLVAEALLTADAPNPSGRAERTKRTKNPHPPAPANLGSLVALSPPMDEAVDRNGSEHTGKLMLELLMAVRHLVEDRDGMPDWPAHDWSSITGWLIDTQPTWQADEFSREWVCDAVDRCWKGLRELVRMPKPWRSKCRNCGGVVILADRDGREVSPEAAAYGYCLGCERTYAKGASLRSLTEAQDLPLRSIAPMVDVPVRTLERWARDGWIKPTGSGEPSKTGGPRPQLYDVAEIRRVVANTRMTA